MEFYWICNCCFISLQTLCSRQMFCHFYFQTKALIYSCIKIRKKFQTSCTTYKIEKFCVFSTICHLQGVSNNPRLIAIPDTIHECLNLTFNRYGRFDHEHWCTHKVNDSIPVCTMRIFFEFFFCPRTTTFDII